MPYQPSKEHLDRQIPEAVKAINDILKNLSESTGADERYISLMLDSLARQWEYKNPQPRRLWLLIEETSFQIKQF